MKMGVRKEDTGLFRKGERVLRVIRQEEVVEEKTFSDLKRELFVLEESYAELVNRHLAEEEVFERRIGELRSLVEEVAREEGEALPKGKESPRKRKKGGSGGKGGAL